MIGDNDYNYKLSENRVNTVQKILMENGFNKNKIVIIEGKGRVLLSDNPLENLAGVQKKIDELIFLLLANSFGKVFIIPFKTSMR
jgi:pseudouridine-5'-phosphate glycosidase